MGEDRHTIHTETGAVDGQREAAAAVDGALDVDGLIRDLKRAKRELETARRQFDTVTDPLLIDHMVFRIGAAERQFNYLFQLARRHGVRVEGIRWDWQEDV
ncbi:DUF2508 family protein [Alicyclobacillus sp.]|uniref:DUF2508 family protein n=1 Tax=Alicyclobacillus sp. TaxID=61169 RepID=UPI0025C1A9B6|nr:DUF2508 family protein [Alicyclobacillus sp.]MCL6516603.1 YaaL family protein [Alicyclobacillus sp.]